ncbi:MAG: penicillin-binding protein 2 [Candidatus Marinimicrobia bacterium]|nr:penicillin-binding protein 2 [Candidatus Neomarinimicrobiota bacterium]
MSFFSYSVTKTIKNVSLFIVGLVFVILLYRFYQIQIQQHNKYSGIAEDNRIRMVTLEAPRGIIYDRIGDILVDNKFQYNVFIIPFEVDSINKCYQKLGEVLGLDKEIIEERVKKNWRGRFKPALVAKGVNMQVLSRIEEHKLEFPGVIYKLDPYRSYPSGVNLTHVLGYLREINSSALKRLKKYGYNYGDLIGWEGVERQYESILRGEKGYKYVQVNAKGRILGDLESKENIQPQPGNDLYLTINRELQDTCERILADTSKGAIIVIDPDNGQILSAVSKPDYSPEIFSGIINQEVWDSLSNDPDRPLFNRLTSAEYPPASTFKMMAAMGALENNIVDSAWSVNCPGYYKLGRRTFKCWKEWGHGRVAMEKSIEQSCDVYYYRLIRKMDLDLWAETVRKFGFGEPTQIDLTSENSGNIPDKNYMNSVYGKNGWTEGYKLNIVIGQGEVLVTPIQMAKFISALATRGKLIHPHVGLKYFDTEKFRTFTTEKDSIESFTPQTWDIIEESLYEVVNDPAGTANLANVRGVKVYGKTGTAQNPHGENHAWFIGYADNGQKKVAVTVFLENGGSGGHDAAPVAGKILKYYLKNIWTDNKTSGQNNG